jgi:diketogulonate reductase-like aldo/keto reductase
MRERLGVRAPVGLGRDLVALAQIATIAAKHNATPRQIALAWQLHRTVTALPIHATTSVEHFHENRAAANICLTQDEVDDITALSPRPTCRTRHRVGIARAAHG